ncbi:MAG: Hsp70 family protein [Microbacteriaceae bacterium]
MARAAGIDLGTTYSAVAVLQPTGIPIVVENDEGEPITPSVVLFKNSAGKDTPVVGGSAKRQAGIRPDDTVQHVKRFMGDPSWRFDSSNDVTYRPEEVSGIILRALVQAASTRLGEPIEDVVITVPAYFDDSRRTATKQAGAIAGLNVLRVLNEPTAAALSYGISAEDDGYVLVYDLGGGTFDVTVLGIEDRVFDVLATDGDRNLGGVDWDSAILRLIAGELESAHGVTGLYDDLDVIALLREKAEQAKRALSDLESTSIQFSFAGGHYDIALTREQFQHATRSLLRRTQELVEDTLDASGLAWDDIGEVLLVGGSTRMPAVHALVERLSGKLPVAGVDPDEAVALGAAIQAGIESDSVGVSSAADIRIQDVTSHALGTIALDFDDEGRGLRNFVIIPKNTKIPTSGEQEFRTIGPQWQRFVSVTQGDDPDPDFVTEVGQGIVKHAEEWPDDTPHRIVYHYDIDQTVTVEIYRLPENTYAGSFEIDRIANMSEDKIEEAAQKIEEIFPDALAAAGVPTTDPNATTAPATKPAAPVLAPSVQTVSAPTPDVSH